MISAKSLRLLGTLALALASTGALAAEALKVIVPTAPGGGTDGFFRVLAHEAEAALGEPVVIVNVPGAGGTIGVAQMVRATDNQTVAGVWLGPITVSPNTMKVPSAPTDYIPVVQVSSAPYIVCVHPDFPANDGAGLIAELKKNPDKYTYGNDGLGGPGHLGMARILGRPVARRATFRSKAPARRCRTSSASTWTFTSARFADPAARPARQGEVPARDLGGAHRGDASGRRTEGSRHCPGGDDPLARLIAPKSTSRERVAKLEAAFEKAANAPASRKFLEDAGEQVEIRKGQALRDYIDREYAAMSAVAKSLKLVPQ